MNSFRIHAFIQKKVISAIKKLTIACLFSGTSVAVSAQVINGLDPNFKAALISAGIDTNGDNEISQAEAAEVITLNVNEKNISSLQGIEYFTALQELYCSFNQLTILNVSNNTDLQILDCHNNTQLTSLNISGNVNLQTLYCYYNKLSTLNVSTNVNLQHLECYGNLLSTLNVSGNANLQTLYCYANQLSALNVSNNVDLQELNCYDNQLATLDVSNNTNLKTLICNHNNLTTLNVSNNINLETLYCFENQFTTLNVSDCENLQGLLCDYNHLASLNIENGSDESYYNFTNNPNLISICCDASQLQEIQDYVNINNIGNNPVVTSGCTSSCENINIPDANFKAALISAGIDTNNDSNISECEAEVVTYLDIGNKGIASLQGIEYFTALQELYCGYNNLTTLNISNHANLQTLSCDHNNLVTLNVSNDINLQNLWCNNNQLTTLNLSNAISLEDLNCSFNQLASLNVSTNINLWHLFCFDNLLTNLDASQNINLINLRCQNNALISLNMKNGINENYIFTGNPNLTSICCDTNELASVQNYVTTNNIGDDPEVTSDCLPTMVVQETSKDKISVYPNPVKDILTIQRFDFAQRDNARIYDVSGKLVKTFSGNSVNVSSLQKGIYVLKIDHQTIKFIKE
ncbi:MAG: T9SS type A sorting domain-containing protein [Flavobacteriaceae bacterium]|jgi:Leucine-rich repeat (LRR) protein|nr:T9SS type A sorting domain-containing protein [Flavobacteriaceae bacterium]